MTPATSCRAAREARRWAELFEAIWRCELALESIRQLLAQQKEPAK